LFSLKPPLGCSVAQHSPVNRQRLAVTTARRPPGRPGPPGRTPGRSKLSANLRALATQELSTYRQRFAVLRLRRLVAALSVQNRSQVAERLGHLDGFLPAALSHVSAAGQALGLFVLALVPQQASQIVRVVATSACSLPSVS